MNYNFEQDYGNHTFDTTAQQPHFANPLDYICDEKPRTSYNRTSLESINRSEEIPSAFGGPNDNLELKKIFSSHSLKENMFYEQEEKLCEVEHKFDLSAEHQMVMEDLEDAVGMGSYLREHVTNTGLSGEGQASRSISDFEGNSQGIENAISNENSSGSCTEVDPEMLEDSCDSELTWSNDSAKISREGLRR